MIISISNDCQSYFRDGSLGWKRQLQDGSDLISFMDQIKEEISLKKTFKFILDRLAI